MFSQNEALFSAFGELQLDMPHARCLEERECAARLSTLFVLLKNVSDSSNLVDTCTVLYWPNIVVPFINNLGRLRRDHDFELQM